MDGLISSPQCEVCNEFKPVVVTSLPGIPMSCARCMDCYQADAIPVAIAIANTICTGGMDQAAEWWVEIVESTLQRVGMSQVEFDRHVAEGIVKMDADLAELEAQMPEPSSYDENGVPW